MATNSSWDPEEIRKNAKIWTLEGDANLLNLMKNISNNLEQQANKTTNSLNEISEKLERTSISLDNTVNRLGMLSQTQFVENRVYDDDDEVSIKKRRLENSQNIKQCESKSYEPIETLNTIIKNNMKMLGSCYEKITIDLDDSDDEDSNTKSVIYRPRNPYESHPMPYLIGSKEWHEKWHIGLSDSDESEHNSCEDDNISESISLPSNGPTVSESGSSVWSLNRQQQQNAKNLSILQKNITNKYSTPLSSDEEISSQTIASKTSSSEGASRIVNNYIESKTSLPEQRYYVHKPSKGLFDNNSDSESSLENIPQPAPRLNKNQNTLPAQIPNIFDDDPPELTESIKEARNQNKSNTKVFCESEEENENLFQKKLEAKVDQSVSDVTPNIKKKVVNLFDDEDIDSFMKELDKKTTQKASEIDRIKNVASNELKFNSAKLSIHNISDIVQPSAQPSAQLLASKNIENTSNMSKKSSTDNIFDDDEYDGDELFLPTTKPKKFNDLKTKISNLFDDEPPDDDFDALFDSSKMLAKDKDINRLAINESSQRFLEKQVSSNSSSFGENVTSAHKIDIIEEPISSLITKKISKELNQDASVNTNITPNESKENKNENEKTKEQNSYKILDAIVSKKKSTNIFDSDTSEEENMFSKKAANINQSKKLITSPNVVEKPIESLAKLLSNKSKVNVFDSDISEDEGFFSKKSSTTNRVENLDEKVNNESNQKSSFMSSNKTEVRKTNVFDTSLFDDDSLQVKLNNDNELPEENKLKEQNNISEKPTETPLYQKNSVAMKETDPKIKTDELDELIVKNTKEIELPNEIDYNQIKLIVEDKKSPHTNENNTKTVRSNNDERGNEPRVLSTNPNLTNPETIKCNIGEEIAEQVSEPIIISEVISNILSLNNNNILNEFNSENISDSIVSEYNQTGAISENDINDANPEDISDNLNIPQNRVSIGDTPDWLDSKFEDLNASSTKTANLDSSSIKFSSHFISNEPPEDLKLPSEITEDPTVEEDLFASPIKVNSNNIHNISSSALTYDPIGLFQDVPPPDEDDVFLNQDNESNNKLHNSNFEDVKLKPEIPQNNLVHKTSTPNTRNNSNISEIISKINMPPVDENPKKHSVVKKLSTDLKINVAALIPGSKRPGFNDTFKNKDQKTAKEEIDGNILIKHESEDKQAIVPKPEHLMNSGLTHLNKSRPKVSVRRRPQSRAARQENYRKSAHIENIEVDASKTDISTNLNIKEPNPNVSKQINTKHLSYDKSTSKINNEKKFDKSLKKSVTKNSIIFDDTEDQDWFTNIVSTKTEVTKENTKIITNDNGNQINNNTYKEALQNIEKVEESNLLVVSSNKNIEINIEKSQDRPSQNIFEDLPSAMPRTVAVQNQASDDCLTNISSSGNSLLASNETTKKSYAKQIHTKQTNTILKKENKLIKDPLFLDSDSEDNDLFKGTSGSMPIGSKGLALEKPTSFLETSNVEEIFKKVKVKPKKNRMDNRPQTKTASLFSSDDDDDNLFGSIPKKKVLTTKLEQNSKIFRKKTSNTARLFDDVDDDDDLFGNAPKNKSNKDLARDSVNQQSDSSMKNSNETISQSITKKSSKYNPLADLLNDN